MDYPHALESTNLTSDKQQTDIENGFGRAASLDTPTETLIPKPESLLVKLWKRLDEEVDSNKCNLQLQIYCLMTGWTDAVSFAAAFIFSGFQTGNVVQLAAALARLFSGPDRSLYFHPADRLSVCSLFSFILGAGLGQFGDRIGPKKRLWLIGATSLQAGFMMISFVTITVSHQGSIASDRNDIAWTDPLGFITLGFMSGSMGLQGIVAKRLNSNYGTTVVLTTIWCELIADPGLFRLTHHVPSRDHRIAAILLLFIGAFVGRILVNHVGSGATLGIGAGIRALVAISFWFVPAKVVKKP